MNKFINIIGIGAISLCMLGSCDMDRYPLTSFSEETFYNDEANLELALMGLYRGGITMGVDYNVTDWWAYSATILLDGVSVQRPTSGYRICIKLLINVLALVADLLMD